MSRQFISRSVECILHLVRLGYIAHLASHLATQHKLAAFSYQMLKNAECVHHQIVQNCKSMAFPSKFTSSLR